MKDNCDCTGAYFGGFCFGGFIVLVLTIVMMVSIWKGDLIDERINKICVEAKYKKYQLDLCDKYSPEFKKPYEIK